MMKAGTARMNLLITLLIVGLVCAGLAPIVLATRKRAADVECASHLGQIAQANLRIKPQSQHVMMWARRFIIEAGLSEDTYRCPSAWDIGGWGSVWQSYQIDKTYPQGVVRMICSYTLNTWTLPSDAPVRPGARDLFVRLNSPTASRVPVFGDGVWIDARPMEYDATPIDLRSGNARRGTDGGELGRFTIARHKQSINIGFLDGHTEAVKLSDLKRLTWHEGWKPGDWKPALPSE